MELYIRDTSRYIIGIIDDAESVIWTQRYNAPGDFEIYTRATARNLALLGVGNYVCRRDDDMVGIIEHIQLTTDSEIGNHIIASGRDLKSILERRIVWAQTILTGKMELAIRRLLTENIISPTKETRRIAGFALESVQNRTETITQQITGNDLLTAISGICGAYGYGFKITMDADNQFVFALVKGVDRSDVQSTNPRVVFSPQFDNLTATNYDWNETNYKNVALVAGEGEGVNRRMQAVGDASGLDRYEVFVDAREISSNDGEITDEEYTSQLIQKGNETLADWQIVESFSGEIIPGQTYIYKKDYFVGDVVTVKNQYGISTSVRITEVIESESVNGKQTIPTFENWKVV